MNLYSASCPSDLVLIYKVKQNNKLPKLTPTTAIFFRK